MHLFLESGSLILIGQGPGHSLVESGLVSEERVEVIEHRGQCVLTHTLQHTSFFSSVVVVDVIDTPIVAIAGKRIAAMTATDEAAEQVVSKVVLGPSPIAVDAVTDSLLQLWGNDWRE